MDCCSQIWNPTSKKLILKLEKVHKTFTRLVCSRLQQGNCERTFPSYRDRLELLGLRSLLHRRVVADLRFCFKVYRGELKRCARKYWIFSPLRSRSGVFNLYYPMVLKENYAQLFIFIFCHGARWIRRLSAEVMQSENSCIFKNRLDKIDIFQALGIANS